MGVKDQDQRPEIMDGNAVLHRVVAMFGEAADRLAVAGVEEDMIQSALVSAGVLRALRHCPEEEVRAWLHDIAEHAVGIQRRRSDA